MKILFPIMEQTVGNQEIKDLVLNYDGDNKFINSLKRTIFTKGNLSDKQFESARDFFDRKKKESTSFNLIKNDRFLRKYVVQKGVGAYLDLLKTDKKHLFDKAETTIRVPSSSWAERNITDLKFLYDHLTPTDRKKVITLVDGTSGEFGVLIQQVIDRLTNNIDSYVAFIDKSGDWSILNKIDTNYSNWADLIAEYELENKLGGGSPRDKINEFFKLRNVETFFSPEDLEFLREVENERNISIPEMSFAEYSIFQDSKNSYNKSIKNITNTSKKGEREESNFRGYLYIATLFREQSITPEDVMDFSSYGNRVDQVFGIDLMVNMLVPIKKENRVEKRWVPIQVKTSKGDAESAFILSLGIGGLSVYKRTEAKTGFNFGEEDKDSDSDTDYGTFGKLNGVEHSFNKTFISLYGPVKE
jgi:hypothetical protein